MSSRLLRASLSGFALALVSSSQGQAHEIVGNRFFPATLTIDDPGVNDELSLPTVDNFNTGDVPPVRQRDISSEFSKRITQDFAISFGTTLHLPRSDRSDGPRRQRIPESRHHVQISGLQKPR